MPSLRISPVNVEPAGTIHSLGELFALAHAIENQAVIRLSHFANEMRHQGKDDLAEVFEQLAQEEGERDEAIIQWSESRLGQGPDSGLLQWNAPEMFDAEWAKEITTSRLITPYRALSMAVCGEERTFAFWSYVAAYAEGKEIKSAAETMAREELGRVSILRKERRRAYHREHPGPHRASVAEAVPEKIDAAALELRLARLLAELGTRLQGAAAAHASQLSRESVEMSEQTAEVGSFSALLAERDAPTVAEALVDAYLEEAEITHDAEKLALLQKLAETAIARLAWLRTVHWPKSDTSRG